MARSPRNTTSKLIFVGGIKKGIQDSSLAIKNFMQELIKGLDNTFKTEYKLKNKMGEKINIKPSDSFKSGPKK